MAATPASRPASCRLSRLLPLAPGNPDLDSLGDLLPVLPNDRRRYAKRVLAEAPVGRQRRVGASWQTQRKALDWHIRQRGEIRMGVGALDLRVADEDHPHPIAFEHQVKVREGRTAVRDEVRGP